MSTQLPTKGGRAVAQPRYLVLPSRGTMAVPEVLTNPHLRQTVRQVRVVQDDPRDQEGADAGALKGFALLNPRTGALERLFVLDERSDLLEWTVPKTPGRTCWEAPKDVTLDARVRP